MNVVLIEPQIPPNTGNVARLCAATRIPLHLVGKLGFRITNRQLQRAGLDYWDYVQLRRHAYLDDFLSKVPESRLFFFSKAARQSYVQASFQDGDFLIFGSETQGLPPWLFDKYPHQFWAIPMFHPRVRSLNLASAVAIVLYEALRQNKKLISHPPNIRSPQNLM